MFWHIDMDIVSIAFALVLLTDCLGSRSGTRIRDRLFLLCLITGIALGVFEIASSLVLEVSVSPAVFHLSTLPYYILMLLPIVCWYCYTVSIVFDGDRRQILIRFVISGAVFFAYSLFVLTSLWTGLLYTLDAGGNYARGTLFFLPVGLFIVYTVAILTLAVFRHKRISDRRMNANLAVLPLMIALGVLLQLTVSGWLMILPAYSLALLIAYLFIQKQNTQSVVRRLRFAADTDSLTGLLNRAAAERLITAALCSEHETSALLIIDIDDLKAINDRFGHPAGDEAICHTAKVLKESFRTSDIIARIGGDEFEVFLPRISDRILLDQLLDKLLSRFDPLPGVEADHPGRRVVCSVGASLSERSGTTLPDLYAQADTALYLAKQEGKGRFRIYAGEKLPDRQGV